LKRFGLIYLKRAEKRIKGISATFHNPNPMYKKHKGTIKFNNTQTDILLGIPRSARCVQKFDDSLNSAIHITYRISLRSSSMREPRDPLLKVVFIVTKENPSLYKELFQPTLFIAMFLREKSVEL
jgi:hypothetical protein